MADPSQHPDVDVRGPEECWPWLGADWPPPFSGTPVCGAGATCCNPAHRSEGDDREEVVRRLHDDEGLSYRAIGARFGFSHARAQQLAKRARDRRADMAVAG